MFGHGVFSVEDEGDGFFHDDDAVGGCREPGVETGCGGVAEGESAVTGTDGYEPDFADVCVPDAFGVGVAEGDGVGEQCVARAAPELEVSYAAYSL